MARVLVLRPEPGASATVERARAMGIDAVATPLFHVEPLAWEVPEASGFDGVLLTSANALRHGGAGLQALRGLKAYAVGDATAQAAREAGFDVAATGDAGVERLLGSIEPDLKLLHLCGADRRSADGARQKITSIPIYRSKPVNDVQLPDADIALVHSSRAGTRFAEQAHDKSRTTIVAISQAAADAAGDRWRAVEVAEEPTDEALLALVARLCNKPRP
jgi:uroporphyrinogen-III synthase